MSSIQIYYPSFFVACDTFNIHICIYWGGYAYRSSRSEVVSAWVLPAGRVLFETPPTLECKESWKIVKQQKHWMNGCVNFTRLECQPRSKDTRRRPKVYELHGFVGFAVETNTDIGIEDDGDNRTRLTFVRMITCVGELMSWISFRTFSHPSIHLAKKYRRPDGAWNLNEEITNVISSVVWRRLFCCSPTFVMMSTPRLSAHIAHHSPCLANVCAMLCILKAVGRCFSPPIVTEKWDRKWNDI